MQQSDRLRRKRVGTTILAVGATLVAGLATAAPSSATGNGPSNRDFVVGSTQRLLFPGNGGDRIRVTVAAFSKADGSDPFGMLNQRNFDDQTSYTGSVKCLRVVGNTATVGIRITRSSQANRPVGAGQYWFFSDNGLPKKDDEFDAVTGTDASTAIDPTVCPAPLSPFTRPTLSGNYLIHDAP